MSNELYARVAALIVDKFDVPAGSITPDTRFEQFDFDSLALVELTLELQRAFGIELPEGELRAEQTVGELTTLLASKGVTSGSTAV
jgi:acyl carrier protein